MLCKYSVSYIWTLIQIQLETYNKHDLCLNCVLHIFTNVDHSNLGMILDEKNCTLLTYGNMFKKTIQNDIKEKL